MWVYCTNFYLFEKESGDGTMHIQIEIIWSDVLTRVGHRTKQRYRPSNTKVVRWLAGWLVPDNNNTIF